MNRKPEIALISLKHLRIDVTDNDDVDVNLLLTHFDSFFLFLERVCEG